MRKFFTIAVFAAILSTAGSSIVRADDMDMSQAKGDVFIGFWDPNAPIGLRYLITDDWELGGAIGFTKPDEGDTGFAIAIQATRRLIHASRAHLGIRPTFFKEFNYEPELLAIGLDLVAEVEIASAVSVLASHGIEYQSIDFSNGTSATVIQTRYDTQSRVGFWVKLP
ncbi:MAG: hypothetical protein SGI90_01050 [Candidatus Eisenbacteria bacterium]|nr:hypothetical protein [Candidatus Eisenbacteria bacterium]